MDAPASVDCEPLLYVSDADLTIRRERAGRGFRYRQAAGDYVRAAATLARIRALVIPPAWSDVRICPRAEGHLQAVGVDARRRRQYVYHPEWRQQQQQHKFDKLIPFGAALPALRAAVQADLAEPSLTRQRVVATVVWLLDHTFVRVGNREYTRANNSYGLTTLRERHVQVNGSQVAFQFSGKSGVEQALSINHARVARTIRRCIELPGYELFQYLDDTGQRRQVESRDVNDYVRAVAGDEFTAKDFRTWGGTVLAGRTLYALGEFDSETAAQKNIVEAIKGVAGHLGNTAAVCRQYYVHPALLSAYLAGRLVPHYRRSLAARRRR